MVAENDAAATRLEALQAQPVGERALRDAVADLLAIIKGDLSGPAQVSGVISEAEAAIAALTASPPVVTPKWDVCRNCVDGSKAGQTCTVCEGRGHVPFVPTPVSPPVVEQEAIDRALILAVEDAIDQPPRLYDIEPMEVRDYRHSLYRIWTPLRDAILALTPVEGVGEMVGWQHAIMCPLKHEKRWIYALYPTEDDARRSGQRHDPNTGALLEDAADVRPLYAALSTPAAQGDEVRDALERVIDPHIPLIPGMFDADQRSATIEDITDAVASLIAGLVKK